MSAMAIIVAGERRIVTAGITTAVVNGVVPVVIVIGTNSVPTAIVRLKRVMRPALAGVPLPWSMLRQPIHFAPDAMPI